MLTRDQPYANIGIDNPTEAQLAKEPRITCGACAEVFYTGATMHEHTCRIATRARLTITTEK